jgi:hypothetical protein
MTISNQLHTSLVSFQVILDRRVVLSRDLFFFKPWHDIGVLFRTQGDSTRSYSSFMSIVVVVVVLLCQTLTTTH